MLAASWARTLVAAALCGAAVVAGCGGDTKQPANDGATGGSSSSGSAGAGGGSAGTSSGGSAGTSSSGSAGSAQDAGAGTGGADAGLDPDASSAGMGGSGLAGGAGTSGEAGASDGAVDETPAIFPIVNVGGIVGSAIAPFAIHLYDDSPDPSTLVVTAHSSNSAFLPDSGIQIGASFNEGIPALGHSYRNVSLSPATPGPDSATVTLTVIDLAGHQSTRDFEVVVLAAPVGGVELVSRSSDPGSVLGNSYSLRAAVSSDGRYVVFESNASNLGGGAAAYTDLFLRDRLQSTTTRITGGLGKNERPAITPDGRYVAFYSSAPLVAGDLNGLGDAYRYDRVTSSFVRVSVADDESEGNGASFPGQFEEERPAISDDGRYVAFRSSASNLVSGDGNGVSDIFLRDLLAQTTIRVSVSSSGVEANGASTQPTLSGDGTVIAFTSVATNLLDGSTETDGLSDVFLRVAGATLRVSSAYGSANAADGPSEGASLSGDGKVVAFSSGATNLTATADLYGATDIWLYERTGATFQRVNLDLDPTGTQGYCAGASLSSDGKRVVFSTLGSRTNEVSGLVQTYAFDRSSASFALLSRSYLGGVANGGSGYDAVISADGTLGVFHSAGSNVVPNDTNGASDVFIAQIP